MTIDEAALIKSLIVRTKTQPQSVYLFLRNLINNQHLDLTDEQKIEIEIIRGSYEQRTR